MSLRSEIEEALNDLIFNEEGMRFQGLAVILAKQRWPALIACERKNDLGLDAYASANASPDNMGKGLACSITAELGKISGDAAEAKKHFDDISVLIFATPKKVSNLKKKEWSEKTRAKFGYELLVLSREDIITSLMLPANLSLCRTQLGIEVVVEETAAEQLVKIREGAGEVTANWSLRTSGMPLVELRAVKLDGAGNSSAEISSMSHMLSGLMAGQRVVLEGPAGRGKTTTLVQLATQHFGKNGTAFLIDLPAWIDSGIGILQFIAGMPSFQSRSIDTAMLGRAQNSEHFSFLLNGWNEITESNSTKAVDALRELERTFPSAGIMVATRTHHIVPPLPGAVRLRLLALTRAQRTAYLKARLGARSSELTSKLDGDQVLDDLTRTPFILSEVTAIFEAGKPIPTTKMGVLAAVVRLHEESLEHRSHLQLYPLSARQQAYIGDIANRMTAQGGVTLSEAEARVTVVAVAARLRDAGQIATLPEPTTILSILCAHHILERIEYPAVAFRFSHQQFQEFYAAQELKRQLLALDIHDQAKRFDFSAAYINEPSWTEPFRLVAEEIGAGIKEPVFQDNSPGKLLVEMTLEVDLIFASELACLCGASTWQEVRGDVSQRLRAWYGVRDPHHRYCALAAMLASGSDEFKDIVIPLLCSDDQQTRLGTLRTWPEFHLSTLGTDWQSVVSGWSDEARVEFVSETLHNRFMPAVIAFAQSDSSSKVREAAINALLWVGLEGEATRILDGLSHDAFVEIIQRLPPEMIPVSLRQRTVRVLQTTHDGTSDLHTRLKTLLEIAQLPGADVAQQLKDDLTNIPHGKQENRGHFIRPALDLIRLTEPHWVSHWVADRIVEGSLWPQEWSGMLTIVPDELTETSFHRLASEDFKHAPFGGIISVLTSNATPLLVERVFSKLCELRTTIARAPNEKHDLEWAIERQLEALFTAIPANTAILGLSARLAGDVEATTVDVITKIYSRVGVFDPDPLEELDDDPRRTLRAYLKKSVPVLLLRDDFNGQLRANLASVLAVVGEPEDTRDLEQLLRADIERIKKGREARARGDSGPLGNGATMSYASWHIRALKRLNPAAADPIILDLLKEQEYEHSITEELIREADPRKTDDSFHGSLYYSKIWAAREGRAPITFSEPRRKSFANAIREQIKHLLQARASSTEKRSYDYRLAQFAKALAAIDGRDSTEAVLEALTGSDEWQGWQRVDTLELLLFNGVRLPTEQTFSLFEPTLGRVSKFLNDQDVGLVKRYLNLLPFVDDPLKGIAKAREILSRVRFSIYELRNVATAMGQSHCDEALKFLEGIVTDQVCATQLGDAWINAVASIDSSESRTLLLSFVDPELRGLPVDVSFGRDEVLAARIVELARRDPKTKERLLQLCSMELPSSKRLLLSKIVNWIGTPDAAMASLSFIDDTRKPAVPRDTFEQIENAFVEKQPVGSSQSTYTLAARNANEIKVKLFEMVTRDDRRKQTAFSLLGQIEEWRLEYGRPSGEPRHPEFGSTDQWPPVEPHLA